ncbi:nucleotidyltransferase [Eubacterium ventriosum]|uniref:nucleotidyltransferase n=1 Tax=Eubacterium ventriosum TaxID=39496 RepID=UPI00399A8E71
MKIVGIIAEFNPFHNGHKYLISKAKEVCNADAAVIVCSGNYVQRGMPAIINKTSRCEMAMLNGADLVIELPVVYSTASAELFATASIALLDSLNCVDYLCFGCETDSIDLLNTVAEILINEPKEYKDLLTINLKTGISFPKARAKALDEYFKKYNLDYSLDINSKKYAKYPSDITSNSNLDINTFINQPNNILGIEYIKALMRFNSKINPVPLKRLGAGYHSLDTRTKLASATGIRTAMANKDNISGLLPDNCLNIIKNHTTIEYNDFSTVLGSKLLSMDTLDHIEGINQDLSNRIANNKYNFTDIETFIPMLQSKNYTYSAISRALLHIILDIKTDGLKEFISNNYVNYAMILGFNKNTGVLSEISKSTKIPLVSKFATFYKEADYNQRKMLDINLKADNLYRMIYMNKTSETLPTEFQRQIIIK